MSLKPIFILGCTKSGTSMLRNLFEGHKDLFTIPAESHFFQCIGYWVSYFSRRSRPKNLSYEEMKLQLIEWVDFSNQKSNILADGFTAGKWNKEVFKQNILSTKVNSIRELSDLYIQSIYRSLYNEALPPQLRFMEKSVENAEFALDWLKLYPDAKFIHILRNPYSNLVAIRKFTNAKKFPFLNRCLNSMYNSYYYLYKNRRLIGAEQYKVIIYENLISNPEIIMKELADFIGIEYNEKLLHPTLFGDNWSGNSTSGIAFSGISNLNAERWKKEISNYEITMVNELFAHVVKDYGFEKVKPAHHILWRAKGEGFKNYIMNRIALYYLPKLKTKTMTDKKYINDIL